MGARCRIHFWKPNPTYNLCTQSIARPQSNSLQPQTKWWYLLGSMRHTRRYDFQGIRGEGQGHVRLKVSKMTIFKIYPSAIFQPIQKIPTVSDTRPKYLKSLGPDF